MLLKSYIVIGWVLVLNFILASPSLLFSQDYKDASSLPLSVDSSSRAQEIKDLINTFAKDNNIDVNFLKWFSESADTKALSEIFNDKNYDSFLRVSAFWILSKQGLEWLEKGLADTDPKIRISAMMSLDSLKDTNSEAEQLFEKAIQNDEALNRFSKYWQYMRSGSEEDMVKLSDVFTDPDDGIRFIFAMNLSVAYGMAMGGAEDLVPILYKGLKSNDIWVKFYSAEALRYNNTYKDEAGNAIKEVLTEFPNVVNGKSLCLLFKDRSFPVSALPNGDVLNNILSNYTPFVRYAYVELLKACLVDPNN